MARRPGARWLAISIGLHAVLLAVIAIEPRGPTRSVEAVDVVLVTKAPPPASPPSPEPPSPPQPLREVPPRRARPRVAPAPAPVSPEPLPPVEVEVEVEVAVDGDVPIGAPAPPSAPPSVATPARPLEAATRKAVPYTIDALRAGATGEVWVRLRVDASGRVADADVLRGLGYGLDEQALAVARSFRFSPARDADGRARSSTVGWKFTFQPDRVNRTAAAIAAPSGGGGQARAAPPASRPSRPVSPSVAPVARGGSGVPLAASIGALPAEERERLCTWSVAIRGGSGAPTACRLPEEDDLDTAGDRWRIDDPTTGEEQARRENAGGLFRAPNRHTFVPTRLQCIDETHAVGTCMVTVHEFEACSYAMAIDPCTGLHSPACAPLARCTGRLRPR